MQASFGLLFFKTIAVIIAGVFFFSFFQTVFAVTVTISDLPSSISTDPFTVTASVSGASAGTNYLRVDLYKEGSQNYFGETNVNKNWYSGSDGTQFFPIAITSGTVWTGAIQGKFGSPSTTDYDGPGIYRMRIRRYTASGNYTASEADDSSVVVNISVPTSTPIPTDTPTPTATPEPTNLPTATKTPTFSPTNTLAPTKIPATPTSFVKSTATLTQKVSASSTVTASEEGSNASGSVLADSVENGVSSSSTDKKEKKELIASVNTEDNTSKILIGVGIVFLLVCGILATDLVGKIKSKLRQIKE